VVTVNLLTAAATDWDLDECNPVFISLLAGSLRQRMAVAVQPVTG